MNIKPSLFKNEFSSWGEITFFFLSSCKKSNSLLQELAPQSDRTFFEKNPTPQCSHFPCTQPLPFKKDLSVLGILLQFQNSVWLLYFLLSSYLAQIYFEIARMSILVSKKQSIASLGFPQLASYLYFLKYQQFSLHHAASKNGCVPTIHTACPYHSTSGVE
jgi:hypothetical protein